MITDSNIFQINDTNSETLGELLSQLGSILGVGTRADGRYYLADMCQADSINKWAFRKGVRHSVQVNITDDQIKAIKCGLVPTSVSKLLATSIGATASASYTKDEGLAEIAEWGYNKPDGSTPNRLRDFDGYNHFAVAPDSGWAQMDIDSELLAKMRNSTITLANTGNYAGYNFKMTPSLLTALYETFSMRIGPAGGESIGTITNMDIPISYVASLDGNYRIALAVYIPNSGWGIFAGRMTIAQYFKENLGTALNWLLPDLATNPYVANLMYQYVNANGYSTFDVVPLLVKDLGSTYINGVFCLRSVDGVTSAYCMPSGMRSIAFACGTPETPKWFKVSYDSSTSAIKGFIENTDTAASHTFGYTYTVYVNGVATTTQSGSVTLAAGEKRQIAGAPAGGGLNIVVTSQDGEAIN